MLRSIVAVVVGFLVIGTLAFGMDYALMAAAPETFNFAQRVESPPILLFALAYVFAFATLGCWLAARLAADRPLQHALALGALGLVFNVIGTVANWDHAPTWYHVVALLMVMPAAWLGGWLRERQLQRRPAAPARG